LPRSASAKPKRLVHVGTGGWGAYWCRTFLPPSVAEGLVEVVAAVDVDRAALQNARDSLGLKTSRLFTDLRQALTRVDADFCTVVVPPAFHEEVVATAVEHGLHVLCEKPLADTLAGAVRIERMVRAAGLKGAVIQNHRFDQDKTSLREALRSGRYGELDLLSHHFSIAGRTYGTFGKYRHEMADVLMLDASIHHFDMLIDLAGSPCRMVLCETWRPGWAEYGGDSQGIALLRFENGVRAVYEASMSAPVSYNAWGQDHIRADCRDAMLLLDHRRLAVHPAVSKPTEPHEEIALPLLERPRWGHRWLLEQFVAWLDGGPPMATEMGANLGSLATVFAAIESSRTGLPVDPLTLITG
jgi:predicted dehydrogenase